VTSEVRLAVWTSLTWLFALARPNAFAQRRPQVDTTTFGQDEAAATAAYWTPERLENAKPMPLLTGREVRAPEELGLPSELEPEFSLPAEPSTLTTESLPLSHADQAFGPVGTDTLVTPNVFAYPYPLPASTC
jgi:hypothetical protein